MNIVVYILIGFLIGFLISFIIYRISVKQNKFYLQKENKILYQENLDLTKQKNSNEQTVKELKNQKSILDLEISDLENQKAFQNELLEEKKKTLKEFIDNSQEERKAILKGSQDYVSQVENATSYKINEIKKKYSDQEQEIAKNYEDLFNSYKEDFQQKKNSIEEEFLIYENKLKEFKYQVDCACEINRKIFEDQNQLEAHKLLLTDTDKEEIKQLNSIKKCLRNPEPLNKVIWKVYYEKPYTDLVNRIANGQKTGIYKITNLENQMCYIGQAVNIAERFRQHIKRGLGAEAATKNKLYPAMYAIGPENFSFEIIEECDKSQLNDREDYWQDFYHAKDYGYSIK